MDKLTPEQAEMLQAAREIVAWFEELEQERPLSPAAEKLQRYFRSAVEQWEEIEAESG